MLLPSLPRVRHPLDGAPIVRVLALIGGVNGVSLWRVLQPFAELQRYGYPAQFDFLGENPNNERALLGLPPVPDRAYKHVLALASSGRVDAIVLPRIGWPAREAKQAREFLHTLHRAGNVLIYDADDDMFSPWISRQQHAGILAHKSFQELEEERLVRIEVLQLCDGCTVSTQRLATIVRQYVPDDYPVEVVPNLLDCAWWTRIKQVAQRWIPGPTIGWAGGGRPDDDLALIADAWGEIARRFPDVTFVLQGARPGPDGKPSLDATPWFRPIAEAVPHERVVLLPWFGIKEYPLGMLNIDILCCPLVDRPFNRAKTPIKALEGVAAGSAVVASPTVYGQVIDQRENGILCDTPQDWTDALVDLLHGTTWRQELVGRLALKVWQQHNLQESSWRWPYAWANIVQQVKQRKGALVK